MEQRCQVRLGEALETEIFNEVRYHSDMCETIGIDVERLLPNHGTTHRGGAMRKADIGTDLEGVGDAVVTLPYSRGLSGVSEHALGAASKDSRATGARFGTKPWTWQAGEPIEI
jgi:hypothetical protein